MNPAVSFSVVVGLALLHAFSSTLPIHRIPCRYWISTASGAAISYVFLEVFPSLSEIQKKAEEAGVAQFLENHIYILSLVGLIFFWDWINLPTGWEGQPTGTIPISFGCILAPLLLAMPF